MLNTPDYTVLSVDPHPDVANETTEATSPQQCKSLPVAGIQPVCHLGDVEQGVNILYPTASPAGIPMYILYRITTTCKTLYSSPPH